MTQLATSDPVAAAPAPAAAPSTPASAGQPQDQFVQVQRDQFKDWNGDTHAAIRDGRQYRQFRDTGGEAFMSYLSEQFPGYTPAQILEAFRQQQAAEGQQAPANPQNPQNPPQPQGEKPLTRAELEAFWKEQRDKDRQEQEQRDTQTRTQQEMQRGFDSENRAGETLLTEAGLKFEAGKSFNQQPVSVRMATNLWHSCLEDAVSQTLPAYIANNPQLRAQAVKSPASPAAIGLAQQLWKNNWADFANGIVGKAANGQQQLPPSTLGGGPGGRPPAKKAGEMTARETRDFVAGKTA
jgi:hypothetical protein